MSPALPYPPLQLLQRFFGTPCILKKIRYFQFEINFKGAGIIIHFQYKVREIARTAIHLTKKMFQSQILDCQKLNEICYPQQSAPKNLTTKFFGTPCILKKIRFYQFEKYLYLKQYFENNSSF